MLATLLLLLAVPSTRAATTTLIPRTSLDSESTFSEYWARNYPWGTDHNGSARMTPARAKVENGTLTITASRVPPGTREPQATHGGKKIDIRYLSGAVHARENFTVEVGGGVDYVGEFRATSGRGTWPAFWLTYTQGWPPEIDIAEWKGDAKIHFNTFNTSSELSWRDLPYPDPDNFHKVRCETRDAGNGRDARVRFYLDDEFVAEHVGRGYVGKAMYLIINLQMEGSSGAPGPEKDTLYEARNIEVISYNT